MKIMWASNAPWCGTGYGSQTAQVCERLKADGHEIAIAANYGLSGARLDWEGIPVFPTGQTSYSNDLIPAHAQEWFNGEPGWLILLFDAWALKSPHYKDLNTAVWTPVDHHPTPPLVAKHFEDHDSVPIAMSEWGQKQLTRSGLEPLYAPHGIDTKTLHAIPTAEARKVTGLPADKFIIGMVANNKGKAPSRKAFAENFLAFATLHADNPDTLLYVHAEHQGNSDGVDLQVLATACGIPEDALIFTDQYRYVSGAISLADMAQLYASFDVLLSVSMGEGFGIPTIEAQACGTPVIASDFAASSELIAPDAGYRVAGQPWWDDMQTSFFTMPLVADIAKCMQHIYQHRDMLEPVLSPVCRKFAEQYDADLVFDQYWRPIIVQLESMLPDTTPIESVQPLQ